MIDRQVFTPENREPSLPLSPVTRIGATLYVSGQIGLDPSTKAIEPGGVGPQTHRALDNLAKALALAGATFEHIAKVNVYLTDMNDFAEFNSVYRSYFTTEPPARTTLGVSKLPHPDAIIEVDAIAIAP